MKIYCEAHEITDSEEADFIRIPADEDFESAMNDVLSLLNPAKKYRIYKHLCRHDEAPKKACTLILVKEVKGHERALSAHS